MSTEIYSPDKKPYMRFETRKPGVQSEPIMMVLQGPATPLNPNNPAGIRQILGVVPETLRLGYADLNEGFFLHYMLTSDVLQGIYTQHKTNTTFKEAVKKLRLTDERVYEVIQQVDEVRIGLSQYETYKPENFDQFVKYKRIMEDAAKVVSAPFITEAMAEHVSLYHTKVDYKSAFKYSREQLLESTKKAKLFTDYISHHALPALLTENPSLMAISVTHPSQIAFSFQFASMAREAGYNGQIVLGGNTISRRADTWTKDDEINHKIFRENDNETDCIIDAIVIGNGEVPLGVLAAELATGKKFDRDTFLKMPGVIVKRDGKIIGRQLAAPKRVSDFEVRDNVAGFFTPGFMPKDHGVQSIRKRDICPYDEKSRGGCEFCAISKASNLRLATFLKHKQIPLVTPLGDGAYELLDPNISSGAYSRIQQSQVESDKLVTQIREGYKAGFPFVDITDEQWLARDGVELGEKLQKVGLNSDANNPDIRYAAYMRIDDIINENTVRKLAQSGLRFAQFGLETTYEPKMTSMNKGTTGAKIERFKKQQLPLLVKYEIMPHIFIIPDLSRLVRQG